MSDTSLVDRVVFAKAQQELGDGFLRILGYFREDGIKSVAAIEAGLRAADAVALVIPAHTLKGEARQFGAHPLAELAEVIEDIARDCVETQDTPEQALEHVVKLKPLFDSTLATLEREANPLSERRPVPIQPATGGFGRRAAGF